MPDPNEHLKRKETERAALGIISFAVITILYFVISGDLEFNQKALIIGLAAVAGVLLIVGYKMKSRA